MRIVAFRLALALLTTTAAAAPKLTLDEVIAKALASPKAHMANDDADAAGARVDEADAARYPRIKATAFGTISPKIQCRNPDRTQTDPQNFKLAFSGFFGGGQLDITQPIYTFGKIDHARSAARAGLDAQ